MEAENNAREHERVHELEDSLQQAIDEAERLRRALDFIRSEAHWYLASGRYRHRGDGDPACHGLALQILNVAKPALLRYRLHCIRNNRSFFQRKEGGKNAGEK